MNSNITSRSALWTPEHKIVVPPKTPREFSPQTFRPWQPKALEYFYNRIRGIINAPPGAGKTSIVRGLQLAYYRQNPSAYSLVAVPQTNIAKGFYEELEIGLEPNDKLQWSFVPEELRFFGTNGNAESCAKRAAAWLEEMQKSYKKYDFNDRNAVITHSSLCILYELLGPDEFRRLLRDINLFPDELHHSEQSETEEEIIGNRLGTILNDISDLDTNRIIGSTATYFRGDRVAILDGENAKPYEDNIFTLPMDQHLRENMTYLKGLKHSTLVYTGDYFNAVDEVLALRVDNDCILWLVPWPESWDAKITGLDKIGQSEKLQAMIEKHHKLNGRTPCVINLVPEELQKVRMKYLQDETTAGQVTDIIALRVGREGFDFPRLNKLVIIGMRNSMTDLYQSNGRIIRDWEGKEIAESYLVLRRPVVGEEDVFYEDFNNLLKANMGLMLGILTAQPKFKYQPVDGPKAANIMVNQLTPSDTLDIMHDVKLECLMKAANGSYAPTQDEMVVMIEKSCYNRGIDITTIDVVALADEFRVANFNDGQETPSFKKLHEGFDVSGITMDLIWKTDYLMQESVVHEKSVFEYSRKVFESSNNAYENKQKLLEMARNGELRPIELRHPLGVPLMSYTRPSQRNSYDEEFTVKIQVLRPDWFIISSEKNKQALLEIAKKGESRPASKKHPLGVALVNYTNKANNIYDKEFDIKIRTLRPDWFIDTVEENKKQLLVMAQSGKPRPICYKDPLGLALSWYTSGKMLDKVFTKKIRTLRPDWFVDIVKENKKQLLEIAKRGEPRPLSASTALGRALVSYTSGEQRGNRGSYDKAFTLKIRKLRPDWFEDLVVAKKKQTLFLMAKNGEPRPVSKKHKFGYALSRYTNIHSTGYDNIFTVKIKKLRPDWFEGAEEKKVALLMLAKNGEPRPAQGKHPLAAMLSKYTNKTSGNRCYDEKFDKEIRKLRPDWFPSLIVDENKKMLLKMALNGEIRPNQKKHSLGRILGHYTDSKSNCYDKEFDRQIQVLRPDWFVRGKKKNV